MSTYDRHPGNGPIQRATAGSAAPAIGKHTLTGQLDPNVPLRSPPHAAPAHQVAERDALNCWITVIVRGPDGDGRRDRDRGSTTRPSRPWTEAAPAPRRAPGSTSSDPAPRGPASGPRPGPAHEQLLAAFWREVDAADAAADQAAEDSAGDRGAPGGDPHGRTGPDTAIGGAGSGGPQARVGGDHKGSQTRGAAEGTRFGSALGVAHGSEGGRFGGEDKPGDDGVRMAGAIAEGVIAVPAALKGIVELLLLADAGGEPRARASSSAIAAGAGAGSGWTIWSR